MADHRAEQTLSKYQPPQDHPDVEICIVQGTQYPFHKPTKHLSKYPVGFKGCYNCGESDHFRSSDCKKDFNKMDYFEVSQPFTLNHALRTKNHEA